MSREFLNNLFYIDTLSQIMMGLVGFVVFVVAVFASRYLKGDSQFKQFYQVLACLTLAVFIMVSANNIILFLASWVSSNALLVRLMIYKSNWQAARQSGILAAKTFGLGFISLSLALGLVGLSSGHLTLQEIIHSHHEPLVLNLALVFITLAAMSQSAIWPFHKWLLSSLNSPTPVSAIMHAGLVNGGGFLLVKFSPMYFSSPGILTLIFIIGIITAFLGTLWKLMQSDIKRMLACSTLGQMGFMIAQCGMGLFPAAVAHLCWHGLFKAYLFLASGSAAQEKRLDLDYPPQPKQLSLALLCGIIASYSFMLVSDKSLFAGDTTLILIIVACIAGTQFALPFLKQITVKKLPILCVASGITGSIYGLSVHSIEALLIPLNIMRPQPLNMIHIIGIGILTASWLSIVLARNIQLMQEMPSWFLKLYVQMFNASQPHPKTITTHKSQYHT